MGLNKHMMLEEHALEQEIARLEGRDEAEADLVRAGNYGNA